MLSMTPLKNAAAAKSYYEKDNYYAKESEEAAKLSHWWGKGAQKLGLSSYVNVEIFEKLLEGKLPSGQQLGRTAEKNKVHRPGYDLTFSAPKSVSLLAEIGNDHHIYLAHHKAVEEAMSYIEGNAIKTRAFRNGEIVFERVDNIAVAMFRHDTSREQDPALHTHCVLLNMVERADGKWRSISSESLFDHKMTAGLIYRARLAVELQTLGYEIEQTHSDGRFEIKNISKEVIEHFSQRRQQIEERLEKEGWEGGKASAKVTLDTRKRKKDVEREFLKETWQSRCAEIQFDPQEIISAAKTKSSQATITLKNPFVVAKDAIQYAATHLGEREAVFADRDLIRESLAHALGKTTLGHIQQAIQEAKENGNLISVLQNHWTTPEAIKLEEENIRLMKAGQQRSLPMATLATVQAYIAAKEQQSGKPYTLGQREAIQLILTNYDKVIGIQGSPGTGKTTLLKAIHEFAPQVGYALLGLAPTKNAAMELQNKTGISSLTLQKYLITVAKQTEDSQQEKPLLIILDESSMVSSRQANQLLQALSNPNVRLVMLGDVKQLASIESGKPFYQLQKAGMLIAKMEEIVRQKSPLLREAIYDAIRGNISHAFQNINITEVADKRARLKRIVDDYLSYSTEGRERTLVLVPANEDRQEVNHGIREGLKKEGAIQGAEIKTNVLISRGFSKTYRLRVTNYTQGDIIRFNKKYKSLGILASDYWQVTKIYREKNEMQLEHFKSKQKIIWNPDTIGGKREGAVEVYQYESRTLMAGDKIRWLRNQGEDRVNSHTADIIAVDGHKAEVRLQNQKMMTLDLNQAENTHWDYAFAYTLHAKQGGENVRVIAHMESFRKKLSTLQTFLVAISRAEYEVRLIVDNREDCIKTIEKHTGEKTSALEALTNKHIPEKFNTLTEKNSTHPKMQTKPQHSPRNYWRIEELQPRLLERAEDLTKKLLGEPNHKLSSGNNLRYGKKGAFSVSIAGKHAGTWHSFESGEKGNLLQLIQRETGLGFKEALDYAGQFLGITPETMPNLVNPAKTKNTAKEKLFKLDEADKKAIAYAVQLEQASLPISGTLAERYLREHRGIQGIIPDSFRYHPKVPHYSQKGKNEDVQKNKRKQCEYFPALLVVAKDQQQQTQGVQVIYLDPQTANKAQLETVKRTYGRPKLGAAAMINPGQSKAMLVEGPETGLSVAQAYPEATIMVTLSSSNFSNVKLRAEQKDVVICMDNDGENAQSSHKALVAAQKLIEQGHTVYLTMPDAVEGAAKQDFNDVLKTKGEAAVRHKIDSAVLFQTPIIIGYEQQEVETYLMQPAKEINDWLSMNDRNEELKTATMLKQHANHELPSHELEKLAKTVLDKEQKILPEIDTAYLTSEYESFLNQDLSLASDYVDLEI